MAFVHLGTRRVFVTPGTFQPDAVWMETKARALLDYAAAEQLPCEIVTRDYDGMFSMAFDQVFKDRSIQVKPVGPHAPNLNAFIERWIQSLQHEALHHFIIFGKEHFDQIVVAYVAYYTERRPHQVIGNVLLPQRGADPNGPGVNTEPSMEPLSLADFRCESRLGGLLKYFYRQAA
ncbi:MAG: integrase core domain-containing protein [Pirellulales bacterium]